MDKNTQKLLEMLFHKVYGEIPEEAQPLFRTNRFTPPSVKEIEDYLIEKKVLSPKENAQKFYNFYDAKGWMIGKNKMRNWKSAINTWDFPKKGLVI